MGLNKMATFCRRYLRTHFLDRKLILEVPKMCNKANLRDLIAASDLMMNAKIETNLTFFGPCVLEIGHMALTKMEHPFYVQPRFLHNSIAVWRSKLELTPGTLKSGKIGYSFYMCDLNLNFYLWPWPLALASLLTMVIPSKKFMMMRCREHCQKGKGATDEQTDGQTDRRMDWTIPGTVWSQIKYRCISNIQISHNFVLTCSINNKSALVQVMVWCWAGGKLLVETVFTQFHDAVWRHYSLHWSKEVLVRLIYIKIYRVVCVVAKSTIAKWHQAICNDE